MLSTDYVSCGSNALADGRCVGLNPVRRIHATSHEKRVAEHLCVAKIECYLPSYRTTPLEKPLQGGPGTAPVSQLVFVRFQWRQHVRVLEVPSVALIVGNGREPLPLHHSEIASLRAGPRICVKLEPHPI